jgi:hypothetical protein
MSCITWDSKLFLRFLTPELLTGHHVPVLQSRNFRWIL